MKRRVKRQATRERLRRTRAVTQAAPSGNSRYGRKRAYLLRHGGWGFEYAAPKPWRSM